MRSAPLLALALVGCTLVVPAGSPSGVPAAALPPTAVGTPGVVAFPEATSRAFDASTPAAPLLLRDLRTLEDPEGALIVTRGSILNDMAGIAGGQRMLHDPVLDDGPGSLRLRPSQPVLAAAEKGPRLVRGILHRENGVSRMEVLSVEPLPVNAMEPLMVDDRLYEPGERLRVEPGLHRISTIAPGLTAVEFFLDRGDGPLEPLGRDDNPRDGYSTTWIASALEEVTLRAVGFTYFGEEVPGATLDVLVGPPLDAGY